MNKSIVVYDKFKLQFEIDNIATIYEARDYINSRFLLGTECCASVGDFISEIIGYVESPLLDEWGWALEKTGLIKIELVPGCINGQNVLYLNFITPPILYYYRLW